MDNGAPGSFLVSSDQRQVSNHDPALRSLSGFPTQLSPSPGNAERSGLVVLSSLDGVLKHQLCGLSNPNATPTQIRICGMLRTLSSRRTDDSGNDTSENVTMEDRLKDVSFNCLSGIRRAPQSRLELEPVEGQLLRLSIGRTSANMLERLETLAVAYDARHEPQGMTELDLTQRAAAIIARVICTSEVWAFGDAQAVQVAGTLVEWYQAIIESKGEASAP